MYRQKNIVDSEMEDYILNDDTDSFGNPDVGVYVEDEFLGIGKRNKQKKAEKKIKKAEKQLSKGHIKAAERKLKKGTAILNKIQGAQGRTLDAAQKIGDINATKQVIDSTLTKSTESMNTAPGQIGSESGPVTMSSDAANRQTLGGGGGDISDSDTTSTEVGDTGSTLSTTPDKAKELGGVTVTAHKNWILIAIIIVVVIIGVIYFVKKSNK